MWKPLGEDGLILCQQITHWIRTVRDSNPDHVFYGKAWLPGYADFIKSALFERIRSGVEPLPEPPPIGYACPWYAVVEDPGPHQCFSVEFPTDQNDPAGAASRVVVLGCGYHIVERHGLKDFIVRDALHETSYRFRLWFDEEWTHPTSTHLPKGAWNIQNVEFAK